MPALTASLTESLPVAADDLFDLLIDINRLPEWNDAINHVVSGPGGVPREGDEGVVEMRASGRRWRSRSRAEQVDREHRLLVVRSQTDDGNPSWARWTWEVKPDEGGAEISVKWELHPKTFWRDVAGSRIRHAQLKQEVSASLQAAAKTLQEGNASAPLA